MLLIFIFYYLDDEGIAESGMWPELWSCPTISYFNEERPCSALVTLYKDQSLMCQIEYFHYVNKRISSFIYHLIMLHFIFNCLYVDKVYRLLFFILQLNLDLYYIFKQNKSTVNFLLLEFIRSDVFVFIRYKRTGCFVVVYA